jgi:hypothetical protein
MSRKSFLPGSDSERVVWLNNFSTKLPGYQTTFGLTGAEITSVQNDALIFAWSVASVEFFRAELAERVSYKQMLNRGEEYQPISIPASPVPPAPPAGATAGSGLFARLGRLIARIKNHNNYNPAIGHDLEIIGSEIVVDFSTLKPELALIIEAGKPVIKWKKGVADSIKIYVDRHDGNGFIFLTIDSTPDSIDTHLLPAGVESKVWSYKAIYIIEDEQVGQMSDVVSIAVTQII